MHTKPVTIVNPIALKKAKIVCNRVKVQLKWMDGWMTCNFASFSTVFQSYQDNERSVMKGCVQWSSVYG